MNEIMIARVKNNIKNYLPEEYQDAKVDIRTINKVNESYTCLCVLKHGEEAGRLVNLDLLLEEYNDFEELMQNAAEQVKAFSVPEISVEQITDYEKARLRLFMKLVGRDANQELLSNVPHVDIEDMCLTFHIMVDIKGEQFSSTMVNYELMKMWEIGQDQLYADALENSANTLPAKVAPLADVMAEMLGVSADQFECPLIVVTTKNGCYGASSLFYPETMAHLAEKIKGDFYILPSSVHEVLVLPADSGTYETDELRNMVTEINANEVKPEEKLTDSVYYYTVEEGKFSKIA